MKVLKLLILPKNTKLFFTQPNSLTTDRPKDAVYFQIDCESGVIFVNQTIDVSNAKVGQC